MSGMTAVLKESPAPGARVTTVDLPTIGPDDLLLRVRATSICGTDLHIVNWDDWAKSIIQPPLVFGHEFTAEVVEVGKNVEGFKSGELVSVESHIPCGKCIQCRSDLRHICDELKIIGIHRAGCFAEYVAMPALCCWKIPKGLPPEIGSIMEPMGNAVHAVHAAGVEGKDIAVFGCGPTGLFAITVAKAKGAASVVAIDVNPKRLELAREVGADVTLDGNSQDITDQVMAQGHQGGADVVFDMSGNEKAINNGLKSVRKGGIFVAFGIASRPVEIDLSNEVIMKGRTILGIVGRHMFDTWKEMQRLLDSGELDPAPVITHRFKLTEFPTAIETLQNGKNKVGKVVLFP